MDITTKYFIRPEHKWSTHRRAALAEFRRLYKGELPAKLHARDCSTTIAKERMEEAVKLLNMVFLTNALSPVKFVWRNAPEQRQAVSEPNVIGLSSQKVDFHAASKTLPLCTRPCLYRTPMQTPLVQVQAPYCTR